MLVQIIQKHLALCGTYTISELIAIIAHLQSTIHYHKGPVIYLSHDVCSPFYLFRGGKQVSAFAVSPLILSVRSIEEARGICSSRTER